jgi:hypothetical protein
MKAIYKYQLDVAESTTLEIKTNNILNAIEQDKQIMIYAMIDDSLPTKKYDIRTYGTGFEILKEDINEYTFLNTVKVEWCVFHVFYKEIV